MNEQAMGLDMTVHQGLVKMLYRRLSYSPPAEDIERVASVMAEDLRARGLKDDDAPRVEAALNALGCRDAVWPTAARVMDYLRKPVEVVKLGHDDRATRRQSYANGIRSLKDVLKGEGRNRP